ncbi:MAG: methyl-accepting chemotaxis protein [Candidatus Nitricoxidivorans perseverans]|uniref:Methyl-accepting chemotaxis protein n=1 Tax=Candidatus Nitricoxidivorans perseverans TaxID=2975601 RepID=A0AA49FIG2_9PROT|nr:MAG: methyl-accepting chemotaxis protein [Candidatus Nitricoxidivorans perseverans]
MALKLSFKLPKIGKATSERPTQSALIDIPPGSAGGLPLIGGRPVAQQLQILGALFVTSLSVAAVVTLLDFQQAREGSTLATTAGQVRTLSQQIAKTVPLALQGNADAFKELRTARDRFAALIVALQAGGEVENIAIPASPDAARPALDATIALWEKTAKGAAEVLEQEANLVALGKAVTILNDNDAILQKLADEVAAARTGGDPLAMLTQRIAKNANTLLTIEGIRPEVAFQLDRDVASFRDLIAAALKQGGDAAGKAKLEEMNAVFTVNLDAIAGVLGNLQRLVSAKQAGGRLIKESPALLNASESLFGVYAREITGSTTNKAVAVAFASAALVILLLLVKVFNNDAVRRREEAERQRREAEAAKDANQEAILRLMNEMGDLADGDLTVRATVSEDITGAIADSVNYTIEELSVLVGRINNAAGRVTAATETAQKISAELLAATERQSREIREGGGQVLTMAQSMGAVSSRATESAQVARHALEAAEKGARAVENSIAGMNDIRGQIQETSKRIKRLGESSQEIGEIVELISDITEQTNVLALNAAIQAASAGEAGRGFSVVAEEVQRLAERSGEATKQIAAIVKTIQADTHDAVSAMENSTQGVVEGAKVSDAAGQALAEISTVSRNLAQLIEKISDDTRQQAAIATRVAADMQDILHITEQTTAGTEQTAKSIGELSGLAVELKGSVAGFKV